MNVLVFLGPTLSPAEARTVLPAVYLPPASRGDVYAAARSKPWAIGIVDGYFHRVPSVLHKEVLWAMAQGIHVYGASSMGALRAAELERFGMVGVGRVFEAYRDGTLTDDDEVAVIHGPAEAGYVPGSEAMVNIRSTLAGARQAGVIDPTLAEQLLGLAKSVFYPGRSWDRLLRDAAGAGLDPAACGRLAAWLPSGRVDQKRLDAIELLRRMAADRARDPAPKAVGYRFHSTTMWEELQASIEQRPDPESGIDQVMEAEVLDELRLLGEPYTRARDLLRDMEGRHGVRLPGFLRDWMQASDQGAELTARAWDKQDRLARAGLDRPALGDAGMTEPELWEWYFGRLGQPVPEDLEAWAERHDFAGVDLLRRAVLRELLYLRKTAFQGTPA